MPDADHLILVRHGESTWNAEHRLQGQLDPPLSDTGREQAAELRPLVERLGIADDRVIVSDLSRARETATLLGLAPALGEGRVHLALEAALGVPGGLAVADDDEALGHGWND